MMLSVPLEAGPQLVHRTLQEFSPWSWTPCTRAVARARTRASASPKEKAKIKARVLASTLEKERGLASHKKVGPTMARSLAIAVAVASGATRVRSAGPTQTRRPVASHRRLLMPPRRVENPFSMGWMLSTVMMKTGTRNGLKSHMKMGTSRSTQIRPEVLDRLAHPRVTAGCSLACS